MTDAVGPELCSAPHAGLIGGEYMRSSPQKSKPKNIYKIINSVQFKILQSFTNEFFLVISTLKAFHSIIISSKM